MPWSTPIWTKHLHGAEEEFWIENKQTQTGFGFTANTGNWSSSSCKDYSILGKKRPRMIKLSAAAAVVARRPMMMTTLSVHFSLPPSWRIWCLPLAVLPWSAAALSESQESWMGCRIFGSKKYRRRTRAPPPPASCTCPAIPSSSSMRVWFPISICFLFALFPWSAWAEPPPSPPAPELLLPVALAAVLVMVQKSLQFRSPEPTVLVTLQRSLQFRSPRL